jgi:hypothetical protein
MGWPYNMGETVLDLGHISIDPISYNWYILTSLTKSFYLKGLRAGEPESRRPDFDW